MPAFSLLFPFAYGPLTARGDFRVYPEDFQVDEELGYEPSGTGEHIFLQVRKRGENTAWVAEKIAVIAGVNISDIGYCGRKDRHAITTQWFSVYLPKPGETGAPDWALLNSDSITVLQAARHQHKLRRGEHQRNYFIIRLRNVQTADAEALGKKIAAVFAGGVPNYFGEQRFGHGGNNLHEAHALLVEGKRYRDKQKRGLMLSAARSYLFNQVLAARVLQGNWTRLIAGEVTENPTGPLWGRGRSLVKDDAAELEQHALSEWHDWANGLEHAGLSQERRALVLLPEEPAWCWMEGDLQLSFALNAGEFATAVLRELVELQTTTSASE